MDASVAIDVDGDQGVSDQARPLEGDEEDHALLCLQLQGLVEHEVAQPIKYGDISDRLHGLDHVCVVANHDVGTGIYGDLGEI